VVKYRSGYLDALDEPVNLRSQLHLTLPRPLRFSLRVLSRKPCLQVSTRLLFFKTPGTIVTDSRTPIAQGTQPIVKDTSHDVADEATGLAILGRLGPGGGAPCSCRYVPYYLGVDITLQLNETDLEGCSDICGRVNVRRSKIYFRVYLSDDRGVVFWNCQEITALLTNEADCVGATHAALP